MVVVAAIERVAIESKTRRTDAAGVAGHCFTTRSGLPWRDVDGRVSGKLHAFRFDSSFIAPRSTFDSRQPAEITIDGVSPYPRVTCLILEPIQHVAISL